MDDKNVAIEKFGLVIDALTYAHENNLDINSKEDVKKILLALEHDQVNDEEVDEFMLLLQAGNMFIEKDAQKRKTSMLN